MNSSQLKTEAKSLIKGRVFLLFAGVFFCSFILNIISLVPFIGAIAVLILAGPFIFSVNSVFLSLIKTQKTPIFQDFFIGLKDPHFKRSLLAYLRFSLFTFLWSLLLIIPGIIKALSYSQMFFILAEYPDLTAAEAQQKSINMMHGHKFELFLLGLSFIGWGLLVLISFGFAGIYYLPYYNTTMALYYQKLKQS